MDFRQLEAFIHVAKFKSFSKAGKALFLSQPTISLHISNLEKELSVMLFDRTSKEVNLTPAGREFLNYALDLLNMKNKAVHHIASSENKISGSIQISTTLTPNLALLPYAIASFQSQNPDVEFIVEEKGTHLILEDVCSLTSDLGLVGMKIENDRFISKPLFDDELIFVCAKNLPIQDHISFQELCKYKFITRTDQSSTRTELERKMVEVGYDASLLNTIVQSDNMNFIIQLVQMGLGVTYMSKTIFKCYENFIDIKPFHVTGLNFMRNIYLLTNKRRTPSAAVTDFLKVLLLERDKRIKP